MSLATPVEAVSCSKATDAHLAVFVYVWRRLTRLYLNTEITGIFGGTRTSGAKSDHMSGGQGVPPLPQPPPHTSTDRGQWWGGRGSILAPPPFSESPTTTLFRRLPCSIIDTRNLFRSAENKSSHQTLRHCSFVVLKLKNDVEMK